MKRKLRKCDSDLKNARLKFSTQELQFPPSYDGQTLLTIAYMVESLDAERLRQLLTEPSTVGKDVFTESGMCRKWLTYFKEAYGQDAEFRELALKELDVAVLPKRFLEKIASQVRDDLSHWVLDQSALFEPLQTVYDDLRQQVVASHNRNVQAWNARKLEDATVVLPQFLRTGVPVSVRGSPFERMKFQNKYICLEQGETPHTFKLIADQVVFRDLVCTSQQFDACWTCFGVLTYFTAEPDSDQSDQSDTESKTQEKTVSAFIDLDIHELRARVRQSALLQETLAFCVSERVSVQGGQVYPVGQSGYSFDLANTPYIVGKRVRIARETKLCTTALTERSSSLELDFTRPFLQRCVQQHLPKILCLFVIEYAFEQK